MINENVMEKPVSAIQPVEGKEYTESHARFEEFQVTGEKLLARVKELVHEGNIRRIIIRNDEGQTLVEFPLTVGVVGAMLLPMWAALGAIAALAADLTIVVEHRD